MTVHYNPPNQQQKLAPRQGKSNLTKLLTAACAAPLVAPRFVRGPRGPLGSIPQCETWFSVRPEKGRMSKNFEHSFKVKNQGMGGLRFSMYLRRTVPGECSRSALVEKHVVKSSILFLLVAPASVSKASSLHRERQSRPDLIGPNFERRQVNTGAAQRALRAACQCENMGYCLLLEVVRDARNAHCARRCIAHWCKCKWRAHAARVHNCCVCVCTFTYLTHSIAPGTQG